MIYKSSESFKPTLAIESKLVSITSHHSVESIVISSIYKANELADQPGCLHQEGFKNYELFWNYSAIILSFASMKISVH